MREYLIYASELLYYNPISAYPLYHLTILAERFLQEEGSVLSSNIFASKGNLGYQTIFEYKKCKNIVL